VHNFLHWRFSFIILFQSTACQSRVCSYSYSH
jgi:hypothetical protein